MNAVKICVGCVWGVFVCLALLSPQGAPYAFEEIDSKCNVSDSITQLLKLSNASRAVSKTCGGDKYEATAPLKLHCGLSRAAQRHVNDLDKNNFLSHRGSDGSSFTSRIDDVGFDWIASAENLAQGSVTAQGTLQQWLESPAHCANLMNEKYLYWGATRKNDYWVALFAR